MNKYYITFDMSQEDVPTLVVGREDGFYGLTGPGMDIINVITGAEAVRIWTELTKKAKEASSQSHDIDIPLPIQKESKEDQR